MAGADKMLSGCLQQKPVVPDYSIKMPQPKWSAALLAWNHVHEQADTVST